jgi:hypothetical protein
VDIGAGQNAGSVQDAEHRVTDFLTQHGWTRLESADPDSVIGLRTQHFRAPGCVGLIRIGVFSSYAEMSSLFARGAGPDDRIFYIHEGRASGDPPRFAYLQAKVAGLMGVIGLRRAALPAIAVSQPQECRFETALPWEKLVDDGRAWGRRSPETLPSRSADARD